MLKLSLPLITSDHSKRVIQNTRIELKGSQISGDCDLLLRVGCRGLVSGPSRLWPWSRLGDAEGKAKIVCQGLTSFWRAVNNQDLPGSGLAGSPERQIQILSPLRFEAYKTKSRTGWPGFLFLEGSSDLVSMAKPNFGIQKPVA